MSAIAVAELTVDAPIERAFASFVDFSSWDQWTPKGFRPISGPSRALREGDRFTMALGPGPGLPMTLTVIRLRPNKEICWKGGLPGVLVGEHSFFFEADGSKTRVRSEEPFSGVLASGLLAGAIEREAVKTGERTLERFAKHVSPR